MSSKICKHKHFIVDTWENRGYCLDMANLTHVQVLDLLRKRQGRKSLRAFGEEIGVTAAYLSDVFRGNREPGPTLLDLLGIKRTKTTETTYERRK